MIKVPLTKPYFDKSEERAVLKVLRSGWHTQGPNVLEFEEEFAKYTGSEYAIAVSNCTTALHLALIIGGIRNGDEVLVPSYTFIATVNVVLHIGAKPIFVDVNEKTFNIDIDKIKERITKKTKAIIFADQVGLPCDIDKIKNLAKRYNLLTIEDAACALGAKYKNKMIGGLSDITCFSFHPRKLISCGEGGMITTNNKIFADNAKIYRSHGASVSDLDRHLDNKISFESYKVAGYNYRLTDIQAAICLEQLKKMDNILKKRKFLAEKYNRLLKKVPYIEIPFVPDYAIHNWQSYIIKIKDNPYVSRDSLMKKLLEKGIATRRGVMASHIEPVFRDIANGEILPITEKLTKNTICIPIYSQMTLKEQDYVIKNIKDIFSSK